MSSVTDRWNLLNERLKDFPKFQNKTISGATEEEIKSLETKWKIHLPQEIREAIRIHNGRKHIGYGLSYRLVTTDLLPVDQWHPYEKDRNHFVDDLFQCLIDGSNEIVDQHLHEDVQEHLKVYREIAKNSSNIKLLNDERFQSVPCELLVIGRGMDDYAEEYLLSLRSGRIYIAIHNIPEWKFIGTFDQWIEKSLAMIEENNDEMKESHGDLDEEENRT